MPSATPSDPVYHDAKGVEAMREAADLTRRALDFAGTLLDVGVSKDDVDREIHHFIVDNGAYPAPLNYRGFPKSSCISVNDVVCHGIPDMVDLCDGDIVSIDISLYTERGYFGDSCRTWGVGNMDDDGKRLIDVSKQITLDACAVCGPGVPFTAIGASISENCAAHGFDSVRRYCGHSIGQSLHMPPMVHHYRGGNSIFDPVMGPGMTFTVEPMITEGSEANELLSDGWTVVTKDGMRASQFEHIVLITEDGYEILT